MGIDVEQVEGGSSARIDGVEAVHGLCNVLAIWLSTTETALTAHIVTAQADYPDELLADARAILHERFRIEHCRTASRSNRAYGRSPDLLRRSPGDLRAYDGHSSRMLADRWEALPEAGQVHNLSRAGKPLLVRYDLEAPPRGR